ncbi:MAG: hypothetical protein V3R29_00515, partial [Candidatus Acidoferrales bacterium]
MVQEIFAHVKEEAEASLKEGRQPDYTLQDYNRWLLEVQGVISEGIVSALNQQPRPSAQELENELRNVVSPARDKNKASAFSFQ